MGITPEEFKRLQDRLGGKRKDDEPESLASGVVSFQRVLGIDPSLRGTGYGVVERDGRNLRLLGCGVVKCPSAWPRTRCLAQIAAEIRRVLTDFSPDGCAVEGLFFAQNLQTAITMGEARGAALAVVAEFGLPIYELAPRAAKLAIVGFGGAQKLAVAKMVQRVLALAEPPQSDAADALAQALALFQTGKTALGRRMKSI